MQIVLCLFCPWLISALGIQVTDLKAHAVYQLQRKENQAIFISRQKTVFIACQGETKK